MTDQPETPIDPFLKSALARANADSLLPLCGAVEEAILLETAYRKRVRKAPDEVGVPAAKRFIELVDERNLWLPDEDQ